MNKIFYGLLVGILSVSLAGCVTVEKVVRERVDQDIVGNQGYIQGRGPSPRQAEVRAKDREYVDIKVELPTWEEIKKNLPKDKAGERKSDIPERDKDLTGNRGYITSSRGLEAETPFVRKPGPPVLAPVEPARYEYEEEFEEVEPVVSEEVKAAPRTYTVKEGDSLSKIAKDLYGKASKWTVIYEANSDRIKDPNRVKAGTKLIIPELEERESRYVK